MIVTSDGSAGTDGDARRVRRHVVWRSGIGMPVKSANARSAGPAGSSHRLWPLPSSPTKRAPGMLGGERPPGVERHDAAAAAVEDERRTRQRGGGVADVEVDREAVVVEEEVGCDRLHDPVDPLLVTGARLGAGHVAQRGVRRLRGRRVPSTASEAIVRERSGGHASRPFAYVPSSTMRSTRSGMTGRVGDRDRVRRTSSPTARPDPTAPTVRARRSPPRRRARGRRDRGTRPRGRRVRCRACRSARPDDGWRGR